MTTATMTATTDATRQFAIEERELARVKSDLHNLRVEADRLQVALNNVRDDSRNPLDSAARELLGETVGGESAAGIRAKLVSAREQLPISARACELQGQKVDGLRAKSQLALGEAGHATHRALCERLIRSLVEARALNRAEFAFREAINFPPGLHPLASRVLGELSGPLSGDQGLASAMIREAIEQGLVQESDLAVWQREAEMIAQESEEV